MTTFHLTRKSKNSKTGRVAVSTTSADSCPPSCGVRGECYAKGGKLSMHWRAVTNGARGGSLASLTDALRALKPGALFRHNQAGDLPGTGDAINARDLRALTGAAAHLSAWTYTHKPVTGSKIADRNRAAIASANATPGGLAINLSADNLADADAKADLSAGPVVVVVPHDAPRKLATPAGRTVRVCPAQLTEDGAKPVQCAQCPWCRDKSRQFIVGFRTHGFAAKRLDGKVA